MTFTAAVRRCSSADRNQPVSYISHRLVDVGIGVATGLAVNVLLFPPLQLRPAEHAVKGDGATSSPLRLEDLSAVAADPDSGMRSWPRHDRQLIAAAGRPAVQPGTPGEHAVELAGQG